MFGRTRARGGLFRLVLAGYLLLLAILVAWSALGFQVVPSPQYHTLANAGVEGILLLSGLVLIAATRLENIRVWMSSLLIGSAAAIVSVMYSVSSGSLHTPETCAVLFYNRGFPLAWYDVSRFYEPVEGPRCLIPYIMSPQLNGTAFTWDMFYYTSVFFGILQIFRGARILYEVRLGRSSDHTVSR